MWIETSFHLHCCKWRSLSGWLPVLLAQVKGRFSSHIIMHMWMWSMCKRKWPSCLTQEIDIHSVVMRCKWDKKVLFSNQCKSLKSTEQIIEFVPAEQLCAQTPRVKDDTKQALSQRTIVQQILILWKGLIQALKQADTRFKFSTKPQPHAYILTSSNRSRVPERHREVKSDNLSNRSFESSKRDAWSISKHQALIILSHCQKTPFHCENCELTLA